MAGGRQEKPWPADSHSAATAKELHKAAVWLGLAAAFALVVLLVQPLLIIFAGLVLAAMLDGGTIGLGGSGAVEVNGMQRFVVGKVSLDSNVQDPKQTQLVLEHELGHVLGLAHVTDSDQLMYPAYHGQSGLGRGDVNGLKKLHDVPCTS